MYHPENSVPCIEAYLYARVNFLVSVNLKVWFHTLKADLFQPASPFEFGGVQIAVHAGAALHRRLHGLDHQLE